MTQDKAKELLAVQATMDRLVHDLGMDEKSGFAPGVYLFG